MGIQDLWTFTLSKFPEVGEKADLTQIARKHADELAKLCGASGPGIDGSQSSLRLVIDADDCLDRLYGGYFNDWICGGSWNRMTTFMQELTTGLHNAGIMVTPIFNGASEPMHLHEWHKRQLAVRKRLTPLFRQLHQQQHRATVGTVGGEPGNRHAARISKHLWVSPSCLELSLRMAFRQLRLSTVCTMDDHRREVIDYCRENRYHGILADSAAYMIFQPPSLYSAGSMKLKFSGRIEVLRINVDKMARCLDLNPNRFCLFAALLGNHILTEEDLKDFYTSLLDIDSSNILIELVIEEVLSFVRKLESTDLVDSIGSLIFRNRPSQVKESLMRKLKDSYQYYANGTQEGFDRFKSKLKGNFPQRLPGSYPHASEDSSESATSPSKQDAKEDAINSDPENRTSNGHPEHNDTTITADTLSSPPPPSIVIDSPSHAATAAKHIERLSEPQESSDDKEAVSIPIKSSENDTTELNPEISTEPSTETTFKADEETQPDANKEPTNEQNDMTISQQPQEPQQPQQPQQQQLLLPFSYSSSSSSSSSSGGSPARLSPDTGAPPTTAPSVNATSGTSGAASSQSVSGAQGTSSNIADKRRTGHPSGGGGTSCSSCTSRLTLFTSHHVAHQIIRETSERHQKGIMHPWIYQVLVEGELKISIGLEDEDNKDIPLSVDLYRPIRQHVYAVLFDVRKPCPGDANNPAPISNGKTNNSGTSRNSDSPEPSQGVKEVFIKEWVVRKHNGLQPEPVKARPFEWKFPVPSCMQLWYGTQAEDKNRRMRAFLSCMGNDMAPLLLDTSMVPPPYLMMCCVLRYMVMERRILRRYELDAFLAQAVSPLLHHVDALMSLQLPELSPRGVHLATVFMKGVEHAIFANDACGAPIPWTMTCPWLYFDGKLFHFKFIMASNGAGVVELCDHRPEQVMLVERLRNALFEGLTSVEFAHGGGQTNLPGPYNPYFNRPTGAFHGGPAPFPASRFATPPPPPSSNAAGSKGVHRGGSASGGPAALANNRGGKAAVDYRGGKLEVGGIVVSNWGPNMAVAGGGRGRAVPCPPMMRPPPPRNPMHPGGGGGNMMGSGPPRFPGGPAGFWPPGGPPAPFFHPPGPNFGPFPGSGPPHRFPGPAGIHGMGRGGGMIGGRGGSTSGWRKSGRGRSDFKRGVSNNTSSNKAVSFKEGDGSGSGSNNGSPSDKSTKVYEVGDPSDSNVKTDETKLQEGTIVDGNGSKTGTP